MSEDCSPNIFQDGRYDEGVLDVFVPIPLPGFDFLTYAPPFFLKDFVTFCNMGVPLFFRPFALLPHGLAG